MLLKIQHSRETIKQALLGTEGPNDGNPVDRFAEKRVDGAAIDRIQSLQLAVSQLQYTHRNKSKFELIAHVGHERRHSLFGRLTVKWACSIA
jgi:hypothetical protein